MKFPEARNGVNGEDVMAALEDVPDGQWHTECVYGPRGVCDLSVMRKHSRVEVQIFETYGGRRRVLWEGQFLPSTHEFVRDD